MRKLPEKKVDGNGDGDGVGNGDGIGDDDGDKKLSPIFFRIKHLHLSA